MRLGLVGVRATTRIASWTDIGCPRGVSRSLCASAHKIVAKSAAWDADCLRSLRTTGTLRMPHTTRFERTWLLDSSLGLHTRAWFEPSTSLKSRDNEPAASVRFALIAYGLWLPSAWQCSRPVNWAFLLGTICAQMYYSVSSGCAMLVHFSTASDHMSFEAVFNISDSDVSPGRTRMSCLSCATTAVRWLPLLTAGSSVPTARSVSVGEGSGK